MGWALRSPNSSWVRFCWSWSLAANMFLSTIFIISQKTYICVAFWYLHRIISMERLKNLSLVMELRQIVVARAMRSVISCRSLPVSLSHPVFHFRASRESSRATSDVFGLSASNFHFVSPLRNHVLFVDKPVCASKKRLQPQNYYKYFKKTDIPTAFPLKSQ